MTMDRRTLLLAGAAAALPGCAALNTLSCEVATYGDWPAERKPGRYAFERLPSQKAGDAAKRQDLLEAAAAKALDQAGFAAAGDASQADVIAQVGARLTRIEISPWDDPFWWPWGPGYWRSPAWRPLRSPYFYRPYWALHADWRTRYERGVALLLRDRATNTPLFEAHAQSEGGTSGDAAVIEAMFAAALQDFPAAGATNPRRVSVALGS
jgi:hypothetical protein